MDTNWYHPPRLSGCSLITTSLRLARMSATNRQLQLACVQTNSSLSLVVSRPGNGSPMAMAMNVVLVVLDGVGVVISTKAFSFHNRSSSNIAYRFVTTLPTIAP